jgi:hypothetical protein
MAADEQGGCNELRNRVIIGLLVEYWILGWRLEMQSRPGMSLDQNNVLIIVTDDVLDMYSHALLYSLYRSKTIEPRRVSFIPWKSSRQLRALKLPRCKLPRIAVEEPNLAALRSLPSNLPVS